eukprot:scaffold1374_cov175-Amphora_coffeaeformis.AAC.5
MRLSACPHLSSPPFGFVKAARHHHHRHQHDDPPRPLCLLPGDEQDKIRAARGGSNSNSKNKNKNNSSTKKKKTVSWGQAITVMDTNPTTNKAKYDDITTRIPHCESSDVSLDDSESSDTSTFSVETTTLKPCTRSTKSKRQPCRLAKDRHVRFATPTQHQSYQHPFLFEDLDPSAIWYTEQDCATFKATLMQDAIKCTDPAALAWLQACMRKYRALVSFAASVPPLLQLLLSGLGQQNNHKDDDNDTPIEAWFLGMEVWLLAKPLHRDARRERILKRIHYWQLEKQQQLEQHHRSVHFLNDRYAHQIYQASDKESRVACQWAAYIGQRVAASVRQDYQNDNTEATATTTTTTTTTNSG